MSRMLPAINVRSQAQNEFVQSWLEEYKQSAPPYIREHDDEVIDEAIEMVQETHSYSEENAYKPLTPNQVTYETLFDLSQVLPPTLMSRNIAGALEIAAALVRSTAHHAGEEWAAPNITPTDS